MLHETADSQRAHVVGVEEVIAEVEFREPERHNEFSEGGWEEGRLNEGYYEVGAGLRAWLVLWCVVDGIGARDEVEWERGVTLQIDFFLTPWEVV